MEIDRIKKIVEVELGIDLSNKCRDRRSVYARSVYFTLCKDHTIVSLARIGSIVNRDHATVIHGLKVFKQLKLYNERNYLDVYYRVSDVIKRKKLNKAPNALEDYFKNKSEELEDRLKDSEKHNSMLLSQLDDLKKRSGIY